MSIDGRRRGSREPFAGNMPFSEVRFARHSDGFSDILLVSGALAEADYVAPFSDWKMKASC